MAIALLFEVPGMTQAQYDQIRGALSPDNRPAPGLLYHVAGPTPDGWRVVEVWESQEALDRFFQGPAAQVLQGAGAAIQPQPWPVHNLMQA